MHFSRWYGNDVSTPSNIGNAAVDKPLGTGVYDGQHQAIVAMARKYVIAKRSVEQFQTW